MLGGVDVHLFELKELAIQHYYRTSFIQLLYCC